MHDRSVLRFADLADEPFLALPAAAGPLRDFWLGNDLQPAQPRRIAAEVTTADETFELVASGAGVVLLAEGNADLYRRPDVVCLPVMDLPPARLALAWRADDRI